MGRSGRKAYRDVDGIVILDKAVGISSNGALQQVRGLYQARKAGHCGSLDPLASGLLPICLGQATKFSSYLLGANKTYRASCRLGMTTTTADAEGEVTSSCEVDLERAQIEQLLPEFVGEIDQVPPMYSALKHQGKRLYQLAREGVEVTREARRITIHSLELTEFTGQTLCLAVHCSKGTYIRTLAEDIGQRLGCGAHLSALRRTAVEPFDEAMGLSIEALRAAAAESSLDQLLLPVEAALQQFAALDLGPDDSLRISQGKQLELEVETRPGLYRLQAENGRFIGLGKVDAEGHLAAKRLMNTAR